MDEHGHDIPDPIYMGSPGTRYVVRDSNPKAPVSGRRYLPTLAELIDRLTIVQMKQIFTEHREEYAREIDDIVHDIDAILQEKAAAGFTLGGAEVRAIAMVMLSNRFIWENESHARLGGDKQDRLLKLTHSINGIRNNWKNTLSVAAGDRVDLKIDCFAADLVDEFGNWDVRP